MKYRLPELAVPSTEPFKNDVLQRKPLVNFLVDLVGRLDGPFVLALDSPWGTGKTTLVRMMNARLEQEGFQCVYFNAWQVDYLTDPLVALVSSIDDIRLKDKDAETAFRSHLKTVKKMTSAVVKTAVVASVKAAASLVTIPSEVVSELITNAAGEMAGNVVDAFQKEKQSLEKFRISLEKAVAQLKVAGKKEKLIFFLDELDRCRPTFAIEMLERIKHLFDLPNIIFVLSVDKSQLEASTAAVYGEKINASEYLRRFIDLEYGIPVVLTERFTEHLLLRSGVREVFDVRVGSEAQYDEKNFTEFFTALADIFQLSLRARERCITRMVVVMSQTKNDHYLDPVLIALLLVLRSNKPELFKTLCNGMSSPAQVMAEISKLPGGNSFAEERSGILLESYLLAADPDNERARLRYVELSEISQDLTLTAAQRQRATALEQMRVHVARGFRGGFNLQPIASKVDFAVHIRD